MNIKSLCLVGTLFVSVGMASDNLGDSSGDSQKAGNASQLNFSVVQSNNNLSPMRNGSNTQQGNNMSQFTFPQFSFFRQNPIQIEQSQNVGNNIPNVPQQNNPNLNIGQNNNIPNLAPGNITQFNFSQNPISSQTNAENNIQNEPQQNNHNMNTEKSDNVQNAQSGNIPQASQQSQSQPNSSIRDDSNTPGGQQDENVDRNIFSQMNMHPGDASQRRAQPRAQPREINIIMARERLGDIIQLFMQLGALYGVMGGNMMPFPMPFGAFQGGMLGNMMPFPMPFGALYGGMGGNMMPFPMPFVAFQRGMGGNVMQFPMP